MSDLIYRQAAIDAMCAACWDWCDEGVCKRVSALQQLSPAQPENADCIYCHEDSDGYVKPIEKNCHAFIRFGMNGWELSLEANGWHGSAKIRYCPMCGRDLFVKRDRKAGENE